MSSGEKLIGLALEALDGHRIGDLDTLALAHPEIFVYNEVRQAYQILDCGGRVVGDFPLADEQWRARAVID